VSGKPLIKRVCDRSVYRSFITLARLNLKPYLQISPPNRGLCLYSRDFQSSGLHEVFSAQSHRRALFRDGATVLFKIVMYKPVFFET
jgi:hypothetical protein